MRRPSRHYATTVALVLAFYALGSGVAAQEKSGFPASPLRDGENGVVMLQDGGLLEGQITRAVDWYVIGRGGGQMQIAAPRVQFVGRSKHDAYEYRRQHTSLSTSDAHLTLAEWCLRYSLVDEAQIELESSHKLGGSPARQGLLERRLEATKYRLAQKTPATPATPVQQPAASETAGQSTSPPPISRDLPDGVLEMFTRKVQPILVNNCTASKCHQPGGQQAFQLNRALLRGEANRRTTMQNLSAALTLIDREQPEASQLLAIPRRTHGGMASPIFGARQEPAFKHLAEWVALVAPPKLPTESTADANAGPVTNTPLPNPAAKTTARGPRKANSDIRPAAGERATVNQASAFDAAQSPSDNEVQSADSFDGEPIETLRAPHRLKYGATAQAWQPRDPFDPEIFNRFQRTATQRPSAAAPFSQ
jgi:hypothetical protein